MKTRALALDIRTQKEKIVTAFDAIYMREFSNDNFQNYKFYYVDVPGKYYELTPKFIKEKNTAFFAFKSDEKPEFVNEDEGESITHYVAKKALAGIKNLSLIDMYTKQRFNIKVKNGVNEKRFDFDKCYFTDVHFQLDRNQSKDMKKYFYKWGEQLVVEIFVSHKVSNEKCKAFCQHNIPIFEVKIPVKTRERFELESQTCLSKKRIDKAVYNMKKMFEKGIRGIFVSDPQTEEYQLMSRYKEEIEKFRTAKESVENEYIQAKQKLEYITQQIKEAEDKRDYYENRIAELETEVENIKKHPIRFMFSKHK